MLNLKNKAERETFVKDYRAWGVWKIVPELGLTFYRYEFANGVQLIVTEYSDCITTSHLLQTREYVTQHKLCLMLPGSDNYVDRTSALGEKYHKTYTPDGCSMNVVVDYMTKNKGVI